MPHPVRSRSDMGSITGRTGLRKETLIMKYVHRTWSRTPLVLKALVMAAALLSLSVVIASHRASANSADPLACSGTSLHQSQVGANSDTFPQECDGSENLQSGQVLWHFVLTQTNCDGYDPNNLPTLTANFSNAGEKTVSGTKCVGGVLHWNIITNG